MAKKRASRVQPPPWGDDWLSCFFRDSEYNSRLSAAIFPKVFDLLRQINEQFLQIHAIPEVRGDLTATRFLIGRSHSSFLAAVRLATGAQVPECCALARTIVEQAWYALHIARDPAPPNRMKIWFERNENDAAQQLCKREFTVKNVRTTHESVDAETAKAMKLIYDTTIETGGHPNAWSMVGTTMSPTPKGLNVGLSILTPDRVPQLFALRTALNAAVGAVT